MNEKIKERCNRFLDTLGVPVTAFCRQISMSPSTVYKWRKGLLLLSDTTLNRIDRVLYKYGF